MSEKKISSKIAQPYAEALIDIAVGKNILQEVTSDMKNIQVITKISSELSIILENPLIDNKSKKNIIEQIFNGNINAITLNFIKLIIDRNRIILLEKICEEFIAISYEKSGIAIANVTTSIPFTDKQYNLLVEKIKKITNSNEVEINVEVDPELIGGFTIQLGSKVIDNSLKGQLQQMANYLNA